MRIIAGHWRGLRLAPVGSGDAAAHLRPTSDRVRESLFNVLAGGAYGDPVTGARVLDLFAGTGALGLEALSRGAAQAVFVEDGARALKLLHRNIDLIGAGPAAMVIRRNALRLGASAQEPASLVFLDPPYGKDLGAPALVEALRGGWIGADALVVWEDSRPQPAPPGFELCDQRRYGDTHITFLRTLPDAAT